MHLDRRPDADLRHAVERRRQVTVIDVRAGLLSPTLRALRDIGFLDAAKKGQLTFAVFHILGPSIASLNEIDGNRGLHRRRQIFPGQELHQQHHLLRMGPGDLRLLLQEDQGRRTRSPSRSSTRWPTSRSSWPRCRSSPSSPTRAPNGEAANYSFVLRGYVRHWLGNVWAEYDRIKLTDMVARRSRSARGAARAGLTGSSRARARSAADLHADTSCVRCRRRTPVFIVASPRPRVGKTLMARLLIEYFCARAARSRPSTSIRTSRRWSSYLPAYTAVAISTTPAARWRCSTGWCCDDQVPRWSTSAISRSSNSSR